MKADESDSTLSSELEDGILTVTLDRPAKLNAFTARMGRELAAAFRRADEDDAVRVVIVTGAGRGFCAGADISDGADSFSDAEKLFGDSIPGDAATDGSDGFVKAIFSCSKPSIAAINGAAVGVGLTLTLPMDIRLCAESARFGCVFARRGLVPEAASSWFLPRIVGLPQALRWCLSGRIFDASEAEKGGLVEQVLAADRLLPRAREIAREIIENTAPVAIALTRQMLWRLSAEPSPFPVLKVDGPLALRLGSGPDVREGVAAFLEKRPPVFPGRVSADMPASYPWWKA